MWKNLELSNSVEAYAHKRLAKLDRRLKQVVPAKVVLRREDARLADERFIVEVTADLKGGILRGEERADNIHTAVDRVVDVLDQQIRKYKSRRQRRRRSLSDFEGSLLEQFQVDEAEESAEPVASDGRVVRIKRHEMTRMTVAEAAARMDLLGHTFFLFVNSETGNNNVVYSRHDGDYGLIVPED